MEKLYAEGVAIHGGPESCVGAREGAGEALTGARVGRAIVLLSREILNSGCRRCPSGGRQHDQWRYASRWPAPRGQRTMACTEPPSARTGRSERRDKPA